jgi:hypothetical protein
MVNINEANISSARFAEQGSTPSTPASGYSVIYLKADGLYVIDDAGTVTGPLTAGAGVTDHGALTGLSDDDHTQYLLADGSRNLAGAWNMNNQALTNVNIDSGTITGITDLTVSDGGTGKSTFVVYGPVFGGTTTNGPLQQIASSPEGQIMVSGGWTSLPAWSDPFHSIPGGRLTLVSGEADPSNVKNIGAPSSTDTANDHLTYGQHWGWGWGHPYKVSATGGGLTAGTTYYTRPLVTNTDLELYDTYAHAIAYASTTGRINLTASITANLYTEAQCDTIYYTPYLHDEIDLYDGTSWSTLTFTEPSLALTATSGSMYDVFAYPSSGTVTLETLVWTNPTTRATALTTLDGVLVKSGATTRRYLGTFYATATNRTEDSIHRRCLYNHYNKVHKKMRIDVPVNAYVTGSPGGISTFHSTNITQGRVQIVSGYGNNQITGIWATGIYTSDVASGIGLYFGINSTSVKSSEGAGFSNSTVQVFGSAALNSIVDVGLSYIQTLYSCGATANVWSGFLLQAAEFAAVPNLVWEC